ncbi:MAG: prepilin-type N-terminal cleavage/methylation domain-containing protein, partial [Candidatus Hydrogenedentes bacterium]|nr:prepilin-type N-terminal cleavage/methylation domain-containing protein [Candidatus Hydrogenedentota bacterium]
MERKQGFTLVELLVVMAIIAILASIVLPNVVDVIRKARATRAHSEIKNIEFALTKVLADSDRNSLHELFEGKAVEAYIGGYSGNVNQFLAAQELYTRTLYAILREGRQVLQ